MQIKKIFILILFISIILFSAIHNLIAQQPVEKQRLIRGKMWVCCLPNGSLEKDMTTRNTWLLTYPGHYDADNEVAGGWDATRIFNVAQLSGENIGWEYRNQRTNTHVYAVEQSELVKNYNLMDPTQPEEYIKGIIGSFKTDNLGNKHMAYEIDAKTMAWSIPKYDDFILIHCKLTNTDDLTFENFYYSRMLSPDGPDNPLSASYDMEYMWDNEVSDEVGFIFYDDTSWPPEGKGDSAMYTIHPGTISGDRGDPGNIEIANSRDRKLYSPFIYAFTFHKDILTPNKFGEKKVWRNIFSRSNDAPDVDRYPGHNAMATWAGLTNILTKEQPEISWRDAHAQYSVGDIAGSLWERNPRYVYTIGPYDIAPGESIEWVEVFLAGQMDRDITILGDTTAALHFVEEGLKNLKDNWNAAKELINNNFAVPGNIPPPTPADAPRLDNIIELLVEPGSGTIDGALKSGVNLTWEPVHINYTDPLTGAADFAGYNIYSSNISIEGPWKLVNTLSGEETNQYVSNGKLTFFQEARMSIPNRYCVTSYDTESNESAKIAYIIDAVAAESFPSNQLDQVKVVPNPFRQESGFPRDSGEMKRLAFLNIPEKCTIKIYTLALDLVRTLKHDGGGEESWGSSIGRDYLLTDFAMNVSPGVYIYHIESDVDGHAGENKVGKIFIIK